jgi:hypothetical protein
LLILFILLYSYIFFVLYEKKLSFFFHENLFSFYLAKYVWQRSLYYELNTAQAAMFNCTNDDLKLAQELRKAEAYVIELKDKSEFATKQRIKAKNYFDTVYAKIETVLSNLSNSNA